MLAEEYDAFLFDLDGVVYLGDGPLPGAPQALARLRRLDKVVCFLTNNPRPTRAMLAARLAAMGVAARAEEIVTAGWATAHWLRRHDLCPAYVVESPGLVAELRAAGVDDVEEGQATAAVVIGCDEQVAYRHLRVATGHVLRGARFVATNADGTVPTPQGRWPATGAITAAVEVATGRRPVIIGKPGPAMVAAARQGLDPARRPTWRCPPGHLTAGPRRPRYRALQGLRRTGTPGGPATSRSATAPAAKA